MAHRRSEDGVPEELQALVIELEARRIRPAHGAMPKGELVVGLVVGLEAKHLD